jgi:HTH-type transcriptional regulator / antitoxin HigA
MMKQIDMRVPEPQAILQAWMPFKQTIGVTSVHNEEEYAQATATIAVLLDEIGDNENHPLADVLDYLSDQVSRFNTKHYEINYLSNKFIAIRSPCTTFRL